MIELMVAIAIMTILAGMILLGVKHMSNAAKVQATRVRLENLKSMLAEYELKTRLAQPTGWTVAATGWTGVGGDFWKSWDGGTTAMPSPGNVGADMRSSTWDIAWSSSSPLWASGKPSAITEFAMAELAKIPSNAAAIGKLPASDFIQPGPVTYRAAMLDGWRNPIIFVPAAGLGGETYDPAKSYGEGVRVASGGNIYKCIKSCTGTAPPNATYWTPSAIITAPNNRPFFASAGPDGDFSKGDDNLYSFEQ